MHTFRQGLSRAVWAWFPVSCEGLNSARRGTFPDDSGGNSEQLHKLLARSFRTFGTSLPFRKDGDRDDRGQRAANQVFAFFPSCIHSKPAGLSSVAASSHPQRREVSIVSVQTSGRVQWVNDDADQVLQAVAAPDEVPDVCFRVKSEQVREEEVCSTTSQFSANADVKKYRSITPPNDAGIVVLALSGRVVDCDRPSRARVSSMRPQAHVYISDLLRTMKSRIREFSAFTPMWVAAVRDCTVPVIIHGISSPEGVSGINADQCFSRPTRDRKHALRVRNTAAQASRRICARDLRGTFQEMGWGPLNCMEDKWLLAVGRLSVPRRNGAAGRKSVRSAEPHPLSSY
ncbi:uncharacterized protein MYCFIDRAFT_169135 [Pseudocercospora fijiensis CIRAD86]|uniref:Uncharacterized protein n=1 Tax=Pseudocercospora fijiensis (strain CIRAD86) TaxID=383855 RepID=N1Q5Q8_PSEFD|nr:uncharacterized protein MYCFIDRAFT_169135 [Pseudocercospora fijiensis CIRAD86]EME87279.1 hypothetical protein MYCFIDRAFT_169135 [Pseudocercospora fijiensis CIRAD86]